MRVTASYGTEFPDWCLNDSYHVNHDRFCNTARLVAQKKDKELAKRLVYQRQPVNIEMSTEGTNMTAFMNNIHTGHGHRYPWHGNGDAQNDLHIRRIDSNAKNTS